MNPLAGGAEIATYEIARRLVKKGHTVHLMCSSYPQCREHGYEVIDGIEITRLGNFLTIYLRVGFRYLRSLRGKYDVVVDEINTIPFFSGLYLRKTGNVVYIHQITAKEIYSALPLPLAVLSCIWQPLMKLFYRKSTFVVPSQSTLEDLVGLSVPQKRIHIAWNGVDNEKYRQGSQKCSVPTVLYVGRLKAYKGIDQLLKSLKKLVEIVPDVRLFIVGKGDYEDALVKFTSDLELQDRVTFFGFVSEELKVKIMQEASVLAFPSMAEGFGLTVIEGGSCGTPTVAYKVKGLRDVVVSGKTGFLVPYGDIDALTDSLAKILTDDALRDQFSRNVCQWSSNFDWDKAAQVFEASCEEAIELSGGKCNAS
jgi:glycosyltransferase involved in cell wall biosynthesis